MRSAFFHAFAALLNSQADNSSGLAMTKVATSSRK
jgi:hypothetical protein